MLEMCRQVNYLQPKTVSWEEYTKNLWLTAKKKYQSRTAASFLVWEKSDELGN